MMSQYILVYKGEATDMADMTPEEGMEIMAKWGAWTEQVGPALTDIGSPFGAASSVLDDGSSGEATSLSGYSIVEADDMAGAQALCAGHPYLSEGAGSFAIDNYELLPVPM
jgi:hypothetical protein